MAPEYSKQSLYVSRENGEVRGETVEVLHLTKTEGGKMIEEGECVKKVCM